MPFYKESKDINGRSDLFVNFVKNFMENFEINYNLCILWSEICHQKLIEKINNENSLLDIIKNDFYKKEKSIIKSII